jgi:hypothetical protein
MATGSGDLESCSRLELAAHINEIWDRSRLSVDRVCGLLRLVIVKEFNIRRILTPRQCHEPGEGSHSNHIEIPNKLRLMGIRRRDDEPPGSHPKCGKGCDQGASHRTKAPIQTQLTDDHPLSHHIFRNLPTCRE